MSNPIIYTTASGADIERIIVKMEDILSGERSDHIVMACLTMVLAIQHPGIDLEDLVIGVRGASEWINTFLSEIAVELDPNQIN